MVCYANNICTSIYDFICLFLYRMCWNFYIWGGGCLLKKVIVAYLLRNKKKYEEKNATVKFYVNEL